MKSGLPVSGIVAKADEIAPSTVLRRLFEEPSGVDTAFNIPAMGVTEGVDMLMTPI